jgi:HEAT repeat protein
MHTKRERAATIAICAALGANAPFDFLRAAINDQDADVRIAACIAFAGLGQYADPIWLLPLLHDKNSDVSDQAEAALLAFDVDRVPIEPVVAALIRRGPDFEDILSEQLGRYKERFPRDLLVSLVREHPKVAAVILGDLGDAAPVDLLISLLTIPYDEETRPLRFEALEAAAKIKKPELAPVLLSIVRDPDAFSRFSAAVALGAIGDPAHIPDLLALLPLIDYASLYDVARGLAGFGEEMPVATMVRYIQDHPSVDGIGEMLRALAHAGRNIPVDFLVAFAMDDENDADERGAAGHALATFVEAGLATPRQSDLITTLLVALLHAEGDAMMPYQAAYALGLIKDEAVLAPLSEAAMQKDGFVASSAAQGLYLLALAGIHVPVALWTDMLAHTADMRRKFAILALGCRANAPSDIFLTYLTDEHLCDLAMRELIKHPPANAHALAGQRLTELAAKEDDPLRDAAQKALLAL